MSNRPNEITINRDNYATDEEFIYTIGKVMDLLTGLGYQALMCHVDVGIYVIQYDYKDANLAGVIPMWLDYEEAEDVYTNRACKEEDCRIKGITPNEEKFVKLDDAYCWYNCEGAYGHE